MELALFVIVVALAVYVRIWAGFASAKLMDEQPEAMRKMMNRAISRGGY